MAAACAACHRRLSVRTLLRCKPTPAWPGLPLTPRRGQRGDGAAGGWGSRAAAASDRRSDGRSTGRRVTQADSRRAQQQQPNGHLAPTPPPTRLRDDNGFNARRHRRARCQATDRPTDQRTESAGHKQTPRHAARTPTWLRRRHIARRSTSSDDSRALSVDGSASICWRCVVHAPEQLTTTPPATACIANTDAIGRLRRCECDCSF